MQTIYILSGLGADHRVFQYIDFGENEVIHVSWLTPLQDESIEEYAKRIAENIEPGTILIGLSFGGMVAIEVSKHIPIKQVILISSAKTKNEIPFLYKFGGYLKLNKLLPLFMMNKGSFINNYLFGAKTIFEKKLLDQILKDTDLEFLRWALQRIVSWENDLIPQGTKHIHGAKDRVLYCKNVNYQYRYK